MHPRILLLYTMQFLPQTIHTTELSGNRLFLYHNIFTVFVSNNRLELYPSIRNIHQSKQVYFITLHSYFQAIHPCNIGYYITKYGNTDIYLHTAHFSSEIPLELHPTEQIPGVHTNVSHEYS